MPDGDYYSVLGVSPEVSGSDIHAAYDRLKQQVADGQLPQTGLPAIDQAFQTLGDPIRRLRYDAQLSAPPPPRFQMPEVNLPGRRLRVGMPLRGRRLPGLPQVDPIIGGAVALVVAVGLVVALLFATRGRGKPSAPAESVAGLVPSATAAVVETPAPGGARPEGTAASIIGSPAAGSAAPRPQASSGNQNPFTAPPPGGQSLAGSPSLPPSLLPIGSAGSPLAPTAPAGILSQTGEPPFLTSSALVDMLRAVIAASAVRNAPPPGGPPPAAAAAASTPPTVPITGLPSLPPVVSGAVSAAAPSSSDGGAPAGTSPATSAFAGPNLATPPAAATQRPVPNHIVVPTRAVTTSGAGQVAASGSSAAAPNRIGGPTGTPGH